MGLTCDGRLAAAVAAAVRRNCSLSSASDRFQTKKFSVRCSVYHHKRLGATAVEQNCLL